MFRNYFTIALRNIARNRVFSIINIIGLSVGLACCMLIFLYAKDELTFDRFQKNNAQLYRITRHMVDKKHNMERTIGLSGMIQGPAFKNAIPEIAAYVRTNRNQLTLRNGKETFPQWVTWVDDNFFTVFSFPLISGNAGKVLSDPYSVVVTDEIAKKYFGSADAVGRTLDLQMEDNTFRTFTVTGVAQRSPENSSIQFDMLLPYSLYEKQHPNYGWLYASYSTWLLLNPGASPQAVAAKRSVCVRWSAAAAPNSSASFSGSPFSSVPVPLYWHSFWRGWHCRSSMRWLISNLASTTS